MHQAGVQRVGQQPKYNQKGYVMPQLTAITPQHFANKAWKRQSGYAHAAQANILPVVMAELAKLVPVLPLGFVQTEGGFQLMAITALQPGTNLFIALDNRWLGNYVPAAIRGYPFRLAKAQDREDSILCFDESSGLLVEAGQGEAFCDEAGAPSQALKDILDFLAQIDLNRVATQTAADALQAAALIQPWPINVQNEDKTIAVEGLYRIDETALNALDAATLHGLRNKGALALAYAQLLSMNQLSVLEKLSKVQAQMQTQAESVAQGLATLQGFGLSQDDGIIRFS